MFPIIVFFLSFLTAFPLIDNGYTLQVSVSGLSTQKGNLMAELRNDKNQVVQQRKQNIKAEGTTLTFANLPKGHYAVAVFHDENSDGDLNTNFMGIPNEAYGFSNDARGTFGPPDLQEQLVEVSANRSIAIQVK